MKMAIHPEMQQSNVVCASCGNTFETRSVAGDLVVDVCSNCHPAYTGQMRTIASGSRVARFERRLALAAR
jgi:large subunit ribosomal protein L31